MPTYDVPTYVSAVNANSGDPLVSIDALAGSVAMVALIRGTIADVLIGNGIVPVAMADGAYAIVDGKDATHVLWTNVATRTRGHSKLTNASSGGTGHGQMAAWREAYGGAKCVEIRAMVRPAAEKALTTYLAAYGKAVSEVASVADETATPETATPETAISETGLPADAVANTAKRPRGKRA